MPVQTQPLTRHAPSGPVAALLVATVCAALWGAAFGTSGDTELFLSSGDLLLGAGAADAFADPRVQVGPLHLLLHGLIGAVAGATSLPTAPLVSGLCTVLVGGLLLALRLPGWRSTGLVLAVALAGPVSVAVLDGHFEDLVVVLLVLHAARAAAADRAVLCGLLVAAGAGFKLWGVLGAVVLLLVPHWRGRVQGAAALGTLLVAGYGPFFALGDVATFDFVWRTGETSPLAFLLSPGEVFGWSDRLLQGGVVLVGAGLLAPRLRAAGADVLLLPAAVVALRLATEPNIIPYYWSALAVLVLVAVWTEAVDLPTAAALSVGVSLLQAVAMFAPFAADPYVSSALLLLVLGGCLLRSRCP